MGASIETTLEFWASSLRGVKARMSGLFTQEREAVSAGLFLDGLLGDERRKTGWMRAEAAGDPGPCLLLAGERRANSVPAPREPCPGSLGNVASEAPRAWVKRRSAWASVLSSVIPSRIRSVSVPG